MVVVGYIFTSPCWLATFCHAFCMAASNYRVVCNLHAIMVYNAEAPLDPLCGHPVQLQPLSPSMCPFSALNKEVHIERLHVSSRYATVSTFNYTCMDTVPHKSPRYIRVKKDYEYFRTVLSMFLRWLDRFPMGTTEMTPKLCGPCTTYYIGSIKIFRKIEKNLFERNSETINILFASHGDKWKFVRNEFSPKRNTHPFVHLI